MATTSVPVLAGIASTVIFASSALPMLVKAERTKDLQSYSLSKLVLSNVGNAVHTVYVLHLPAGPIWVLHGFYVVTSALMLLWYLAGPGTTSPRPSRSSSTDAWPRIPLVERLPLVGVWITVLEGNAHGRHAERRIAVRSPEREGS